MEHEVYVPVPAERLREALGDPVRVARAVPGLQQDAGTPPVSGRLKVRFGGHTITYRGTLSVTAQDDGSYAVEGDATEARGSGSVKLALALRLVPADGGTTVVVGGTASADGRVAELAPDAVAAAVGRLLERFAGNLGAVDEASSSAAAAGAEPDPDPEPAPSVFDADVPAPSLEPSVEDELVAEGFGEEFVDEEELVAGLVPDEEDAIAEAAHARRTMIGRSAEEVDHAPPRGRYAPVPAPEATAARATLRWAAPAAALALASAIALTRVLRKRR
ncbi:SRPBCC family protein [Streptomyces sp. NBC_00038]|uniref:SRPBCC family protein n=1 Tax=Streptomyces sp. NBC_00038 TaxID=2903615 RepID=UPI002256BAC0|nr:SRPBCC family protein [Streptomyces sp. NBC_00038]MCX5559352.1 SRPBCC domain-containing protein [Streptomyces sp. NBC_00038]